MNNPDYQVVYGVGTLDDIHNYFPALLYEQGRFQNITQVFSYVRTQLNTRFNLFSYGASLAAASASAAPAATAATQFEVPTTPIVPRRAATTFFSPPRGPTAEEEEMFSTAGMMFSMLNMRLAEGGIQIPGGGGQVPRIPGQGPGQGAGIWAAFRAPVIIAPSAAVLDANTTIINGGEIPQSDTTCTICQDVIIQADVCRRLTACGHIYHKACIDQWFNRSVFCPSCRHDVRETTLAPAAPAETTAPTQTATPQIPDIV
jgi:hypothetical protein